LYNDVFLVPDGLDGQHLIAFEQIYQIRRKDAPLLRVIRVRSPRIQTIQP
jgi:hypothetical protein